MIDDRIIDTIGRHLLVGDGCWGWTGTINGAGYATLYRDTRKTGVKGKNYRVHRLVWELLNGPIPEALTIDPVCHNLDETCHLGRECRHRRCSNPAHLEIVPLAENIARRPPVTRCPRGHEYTTANTYVNPTTGHRFCRRCHVIEATERNRRNRTKARA